MVFLSAVRRSVPEALKNFTPFFDRLKTKGGIHIPEKAQGKVLEATVVAVGPGYRTEGGTTVPMSLNVGDKVLLPEYGGSKMVVENDEYFIFYEKDIIGKFK